MNCPANRLKYFMDQFKKATSGKSHEEPFVFEEDANLSLHFDSYAIQSVMRKSDPESLVLSYTRKMLGFLFFQPQPDRIAMIGLGGGSLAKYCTKYLPNSHFTAVEINARVIALRDKFHIPADSDKFTVIQANGANFVANRQETVDVLLVDGFDEKGQPPKLCSAGFYDNCYAKLNDGGVMVVNLHGSDIKFGTYTSRIRDSFEGKVVVIDAEDDSNKIVFAYKGKNFPPSADPLLERARISSMNQTASLNITALKILQRSKIQKNHAEWERFLGGAL